MRIGDECWIVVDKQGEHHEAVYSSLAEAQDWCDEEGDITVHVRIVPADIIRQLNAELAAWREAADDQDLDCCQCQCGRWVIQVPDGMVLCDGCAKRETKSDRPGLDRAGIERVIGQKGVPVGGGFGGLKLAETASAVAKPEAPPTEKESE